MWHPNTQAKGKGTEGVKAANKPKIYFRNTIQGGGDFTSRLGKLKGSSQRIFIQQGRFKGKGGKRERG